VSAADAGAPVTEAEAAELFADLADCKALVLAVSGGPDSTALLVLAARWRAALRKGPALLAVTVDHGLRPEARREAAAVKRLAASLGISHRTLRWTGRKPATGLQTAARNARYRLLAAAAERAKARCNLTAHTLDDQAETVLFRLARGSGLTGLGAMARIAPVPANSSSLPGSTRQSMGPLHERRRSMDARVELRDDESVDCGEGILLIRPLLDIRKTRLIATLAAAGISFAEDPSNRDPRYARARLRAAMPSLAAEGLTPARLALLAKRLRRADEAIETEVERLAAALAPQLISAPGARYRAPIALAVSEWSLAAAEIRLRLLGRLIAFAGHEGAVELAKLESVERALMAHCSNGLAGRLRRTLAGTLITLAGDRLTVARAPPRQAERGRSKRRRASPDSASIHQASAK
jgi:tRNA(Ile)-lysidine synthase